MNPLPKTERPLTRKQLLGLRDKVDNSPIPFSPKLAESVDLVEVVMVIGKTTLVLPISFGAGMALADQPYTYVSNLHSNGGEWVVVVNGQFTLEGQARGVGEYSKELSEWEYQRDM